jgi:hypothetical protein
VTALYRLTRKGALVGRNGGSRERNPIIARLTRRTEEPNLAWPTTQELSSGGSESNADGASSTLSLLETSRLPVSAYLKDDIIIPN